VSLTLFVALIAYPFVNTRSETGTLDALTKLTSLLEKAGDIVANLANGIENANASGLRIYDTYQARKSFDRLRDLHVSLVHLTPAQQTLVLDPLDQYLQDPTPDPTQWPAIQANLDAVIVSVADIETSLAGEESNFVLQPEYAQLVQVVHSRTALLQELKTISAPQTDAELDQLAKLAERYRQLVTELQTLNKALANYLEALP
jgi:hypothetical protein